MKTRAYIHLIGKHNLVNASQRDLRWAAIAVNDMRDIFIKYFSVNPFIATNECKMYEGFLQKKSPVLISIGASTQLINKTPVLSFYDPYSVLKQGPMYYKNYYWNIYNQICNKKEEELYTKLGITQLPYYPTAGTDMQKVLFIEHQLRLQ